MLSLPEEEGRPAPAPNRDDDDTPPVPPTPPQPSPIARPKKVDSADLKDGFRLTANSEYDDYPTSLRIRMAYADGSRKPRWSKYDFSEKELSTELTKCTGSFSENVLTISDWEEDSVVEVRGFDDRRELDISIT